MIDWAVSPVLVWSLLAFLALLIIWGVGLVAVEFFDNHHIDWIERRSH